MDQRMMTHLGMRGFAAMAVLIYHYSQLFVLQFGAVDVVKAIQGVQWFIDAFFVLSGFIMGSLYAERLARREITARQYYQARFARIYPLHLLTLVWMVVVLLQLGTPWGELRMPVLRQLFLVHGWGLTDAYYLNHPSWSVSGEMAAYLILPLIAGIVVGQGRGLWGLAAVALILLAAFTWLVQVQDVPPERLTLLRAISGFLIGIVLSRIRHLSSAIPAGVVAMLQAGLAVSLLTLMFLGATLAFILPMLAALIFLSWDDRGPLARVFSRPAFLQLGIWSYGIYMLHIPVVFAGFLFWGRFVGELTSLPQSIVFVLLCTMATIGLSWASFRFFEMPLRSFLRPKRRPLVDVPLGSTEPGQAVTAAQR